MKNLLIIFMLTLSINSFASDTLTVNNTKIEKVIEHKTTNSKGKPVTKYYFMYNGELVNTSKTVVDKYNLCKKYNAKCALAIVCNKKNKRIILN